MGKGVYYYALGEDSLWEAKRSAESVKRHMPDLPIEVATDVNLPPQYPFDTIRRVESRIDHPVFHDFPHYPCQAYLGRNLHLFDAPFEQTLFLDADTYVTQDIGGIFELVGHDRYHIAMAPTCSHWKYSYWPQPEGFTSVNCGVILYRKCDEVTQLANAWRHYLHAIVMQDIDNHKLCLDDEEAMGMALWSCPQVKMYMLTHEYNFQNLTFPGFAIGTVKILHGHGDLPGVALMLNANNKPRVWHAGKIRWWQV